MTGLGVTWRERPLIIFWCSECRKERRRWLMMFPSQCPHCQTWVIR